MIQKFDWILIYLDNSGSENTVSSYFSFLDSKSEIQLENNDFSDLDEDNKSISNIELSNEIESTDPL